MRANYFHYRIAASIAVLIVAVPAALYMYKLEMGRSALPLADGKPSAIIAPAAAGKQAPAANEEAGKAFPKDKTIIDRLQPGEPASTFAGTTSNNRTLDDRINEALKQGLKKPEESGAALATAQPAVVHSEAYRPDGTRAAPPPPAVLNLANAGNAPAAQPAAAQTAKPAAPRPLANADGQRLALNKEQWERAQAAQPSSVPLLGELISTPEPGKSAAGRLAQNSATPAPGLGQELSVPPEESRAQFETFASNPVKQTAVEPVSTFSIDVDTASYGVVRRSLLAGRMPAKDTVRIEEMINYFPYAYPRPESAAVPFQPTVTVTASPWKPTNKLIHIGIKGYEIAAKERPRANLVFLIDVSGSMSPDNRLPLLKNAFRMLLDELKPDDTVGIVTYASTTGVALEPTRVAERRKIADVLSRLTAGGSTSGGEGLQQAYRLAEMNFDKNAVNRIILATDGDFNVGITDREELKRFIEAKRQSGIYLSVIGVGDDNYNDRLMQTLAQNGNGVAAYADTLNEARKVLVDEASSSLFPIANDVKIQIEFNPAQVSEYRLIGYETRALNREDFNNDKVDAGEIGSGHTVTAIYEITPVGAPKFVDGLRYQKPEAQPVPATGSGGELGFLKIRYKLPGEEVSKLITTPIAAGSAQQDIQAAPEDVRFSIAAAAFGQLLRGEPYTAGFGFDGVLALAQTARGADPFGYRAEFLSLVRLAKSARP